MKIFKKDHLPETIEHNGNTYTKDREVKTLGESFNNEKMQQIAANLKKEGRKAVLVSLISRKVKGSFKSYNIIYKPALWIYTTQAK